ncbi:cytochrome P450 [Galactobacter valiniphilus]|uniref:Cytochrome P450 n=1 Tax=Galactobacter valiniphilus TaxID=2676122 RepID=A0A399JDU3_9MICC|nr:cytochrome P450 [Galactobacter valiniphilus]RII43743.1 cytochrome P450 [Galactobacter valiniphilus]
MSARLGIAVPVLNERAWILPTLEALRDQEDPDFDVVFVDNNSTDGSAAFIEETAAAWGMTRWRVIHEAQKGTGAAADTGLRACIEGGATILGRTDADCLPRQDWTAALRRCLAPVEEGGLGLGLVGGSLLPRRDEGLSKATIGALMGAVAVAEAFGQVRPGNRSTQYQGPYMMAAGCNVGITSELYLAAGGFARTRIEDLHEDRALVNAVRRLTPNYARRRDVVVFGSSRRVKAWGLAKTLRWYKDHSYRPNHVDIRDPESDRAINLAERREDQGGLELAQRRDRAVMKAAHPVAFPLLDALPGRFTRLPKVGTFVKDPALLREVFLDQTRFAKTGPGSPSDLWTPILGPDVLINMDGPEHAALRRKIGPLFTPASVSAIVEDSLTATTAVLRERLASGERVDLVQHAKHAASVVIARLVGVSTDVVGDDFFRQAARVTGYVSLTRRGLTERQQADARAVMDSLRATAADAYRADGDTVPARLRRLGLSEEDATGVVAVLIVTGTETLVSFLPRMSALLIDSGWLPRLADDQASADAAINETLRVTAPTPVTLRRVAADTSLGGKRLRAGERVVLGTYWATSPFAPFNPSAAAGDLKRLWFGAGAHFCLGAPLAMAQAHLLLGALAAVPELRIVEREAARGVLIPAYARLIVQRRGGEDRG